MNAVSVSFRVLGRKNCVTVFSSSILEFLFILDLCVFVIMNCVSQVKNCRLKSVDPIDLFFIHLDADEASGAVHNFLMFSFYP